MDINSLTADQKQALMVQAQQEANQKVMQSMMTNMVKGCFDKCAGTSVSFFIRQNKTWNDELWYYRCRWIDTNGFVSTLIIFE